MHAHDVVAPKPMCDKLDREHGPGSYGTVERRTTAYLGLSWLCQESQQTGKLLAIVVSNRHEPLRDNHLR